jgi:hypothetical protein
MNLPKLTHAERLARRDEKHQTVLPFLAGGETWTDRRNVALMLGVSDDTAGSTLQGMERIRFLVRENIPIGPRATYPIWGITPDGIAACPTAPANAAEHQLGRIQPSGIMHHLETQSVHIAAVNNGWTQWQAGRLLYGRGWQVVPDALGVDPQGRLCAFEIERNVKSLKRRREVISGHVLSIAAKRWSRVVYICSARCRADRLRELYLSLDELDTPGGRAPMTDAHRARFTFIDLDQFLKGTTV